MEHIFLHIGQFFSFQAALREFFIKCLTKLPSYLENDSLMLVIISQCLAKLFIFMAQIGNDHFQVGHMVVGQTLDLCDLADLRVLLVALQLYLLQPLFGALQLAIYSG